MMEADTWNLELLLRSVLQVMLLLSSAVFSGSETALFSLSRIDLQQLRHRRDPHSESIHAMLDEPRRLIISILCGNELVNIASSVNMAAILLMLFGHDAGWVNILVMVPLLLLVGEVTPKTIAVNHPLGFAQRVSARILPRWIYIVTPLREAVRLVSDRVTTWLVGESVGRENILRPDELKTLLEEGEATGIIDASERVLIDNLLEASQTDISHIMTPGPRLCLLDSAKPLPDLIRRFRDYQHPRVPVYSEHPDNVIGFIHSEDVLRLVRGGADLEEMSVASILQTAHYVPPTVKVDELFQFFQKQGIRCAIVLGEFGEVLGIVTMADVLAFIFGELTTHVRGSEEYERTDHSHIAPGWMRLLDFYTLSNIDIDDPVMTTVGGLVFRLFGRLPKVGEAVDYEGYHFRVLGLDGLRINRVEVSKLAKIALPAPESESGTEPSETAGLLSRQSVDGGDAGADGGGSKAAKRKRKQKKKQRDKAKPEAPEASGSTGEGSGSESDSGKVETSKSGKMSKKESTKKGLPAGVAGGTKTGGAG
jgi:CBS domain containing-hemolysin-like protein